MTITEKFCLRFCEQLLHTCSIPEKVVRYSISSDTDENDFNLKIVTEEDVYSFSITVLQNGNNITSGLETSFSVKKGDISMVIRDISIDGYSFAVHRNIDVLHLKSILNSLALIHSKSIEGGYFRKIIGQSGHTLNTKEYSKVQDALYRLIKKTNSEHIDANLLQDGINNILQSSEKAFTPDEKNVYVKNDILHNKLFFKSSDAVVYKIINLGSDKHLPLVYDVLLTIFYYSDQETRQSHFHELTNYYYRTLETYLHSTGSKLSTILPAEEYEMQLKSFTPYIKLEIVYSFCRKLLKELETPNGEQYDVTSNNLVWTAILEIYECINYPPLSREDCYRVVRNKIGTNDYQFHSWTLKALEERPGFLGDYFRLNIIISQNNKQRKLNLFAKHIPTNNEVAKELATVSFAKEEFFYNKFMNELISLGLEEITDFAPKCYFSRSNDVLIFDDLSVLNYKTPDKTKPFSYETMQLLIKKLARLHACSLLYEEINTEKTGDIIRIDEKYEEYIKEINLRIDEVNNITKISIVGMGTVLNYILDIFPDIPKEITMEDFKKKAKTALENLFSTKVKKSEKYRNVICQGDFWGSNILLQKNEEDVVVDSRIIDYQLIRYCPPTHDLLFLIYVNCDKDTRTKYMQTFIRQYYNELSENLRKYNFDLDKIYTYRQFLDCCNYMKSAGICIASLYLPIVMYPNEKVQAFMYDEEKMTRIFTIDRREIVEEEIHHEGPYRQRIRDIIQDLYEVCVKNDI